MAIEPNTAPVPVTQVQTGCCFSVITVLGILIAISVMLGAVFLGGWGIYATIIKQYETLISGLLALFGAIVTVFVLSKQVRQGEMHHREHREKKFAAARAVSTLALSDLIRYANESLNYIVNGKKRIKQAINENDNSLTITDDPPPIPENLIPVLRDIVEYGDAEISEITRRLISEIQTHRSRMLNLPRSHVTPDHSGGDGLHDPSAFDSVIRDTAALSAFTDNFFRYARFEPNAFPALPRTDEVDFTLFKMCIEKHAFPNAFYPKGTIDPFYPKG